LEQQQRILAFCVRVAFLLGGLGVCTARNGGVESGMVLGSEGGWGEWPSDGEWMMRLRRYDGWNRWMLGAGCWTC
jgi:hypothetical protein